MAEPITRKQFLTQCWQFIVKPILLLFVISLLLRILIEAINNEGNTRFLILLIAGASILICLLQLFGNFFTKLFSALYNSFSEKTRRILSRLHLYLTYSIPLVELALLYFMWQKDPLLAVMWMVYLLLKYLYRNSSN